MTGAKFGGVHRDLRSLYDSGTTVDLSDRDLLERFASEGDEAAFAALVARHGSMVLAAIRGVLRGSHDAEDAFQATFLILARKAGTLRPRGSLGGWLHRVARRVASLAGAEAARRRAIEGKAAVAESRAMPPGRPWGDVVPLLHEELARLPEKYRGPIVLCDLESLTRDQAARQLGWPPGTVAGRLARGRDLLRARLARRGVAPAALVVALEASREAVAAVPASWSAGVCGAALGAEVAESVEILFREVIRAMIVSRMQRIATTTLTIGLGIGLAALAALAWAGEGEGEPKGGPTMPLSGLVVDAEGRPLADVAVFGSHREGKAWGQVVAETRTDDQGRFRLAMPADPARLGPKAGAIWAFRPGRLVASYVVNRGTAHGDVPIRLMLGPPASTTVEVRDPGGKPVEGARVMPRVLSRSSLSVPGGLAERIAEGTLTDARGRATVTAFLADEVSTVLVTARGFGTQQFGFGYGQGADPGPKVVNLMPAGRVEGQLLGDPEAIRGVPLTVMCWNVRSNPPPPPALGLTYLTTDDAGRFVLPEVPEGNLNVTGDDGEVTWTVASEGPKVEAGKTTRVELKATPGILVKGLVREKGSGKPIPGVRVGPYGGKGVESDASGHFAFFARSGQAMIMLQSTPEGYAGLMYGVPHVTIPKDVAEFEVAPIELTPSGRVTGVVLDDKGRPMPDVAVAVAWQVDEGENRNGRREVAVTTDGRGAFAVDGVPLDADVTLTASATGLGRSARPTTARVGEPSTLTLDPSGLVSLKGWVVDDRGKPVAGARVHIRGRDRHLSGQIKGESAVDFQGAYVLRTDAQGRFETPRGLDSAGEYSAIAEADGLQPGQTEWIRTDALTFPGLVLDSETIGKRFDQECRVRDDEGRPIARAMAWASFPGGPDRPSKVATDEQGRFRIEGLPGAGALVFVEAVGFRFDGFAAMPGDSSRTLTLARVGGASPAMRTRPPALPRANELALAGLVIVPYAGRVLEERPDDFSTGFLALSVLAKVDPARALEAIAARPFPQGWYNDRVRADASLALMARNLDEALAVVETIEQAEARSQALIKLAERLPTNDRGGKLRLLDLALLASRAVPDAGHKLAGIADIAHPWGDLGEVDRASKLLREFEPTALERPKSGWDGYARGRFAEELAAIDPDAASRLIEGLDEEPNAIPDRSRINLARKLASRDPAAAERLLDGLRKPSTIVGQGARVAHAMAPKDPARARRVVDRMLASPDELRQFPFSHAYALGMMAHALAGVDDALAVALLDEAFDELAKLAGEGRRAIRGVQDAALVAATLLPVAERIDPALVRGYFWRAASLRQSAPTAGRSRSITDALLALFLARYDAGAARVLLEPMVAGGLANADADVSAILRATAAVDPGRAVALLESMPDERDAGFSPFNHKNAAILDLAATLADRPEDRWDRAVNKLLRLWVVGGEDVF